MSFPQRWDFLPKDLFVETNWRETQIFLCNRNTQVSAAVFCVRYRIEYKVIKCKPETRCNFFEHHKGWVSLYFCKLLIFLGHQGILSTRSLKQRALLNLCFVEPFRGQSVRLSVCLLTQMWLKETENPRSTFRLKFSVAFGFSFWKCKNRKVICNGFPLAKQRWLADKLQIFSSIMVKSVLPAVITFGKYLSKFCPFYLIAKLGKNVCMFWQVLEDLARWYIVGNTEHVLKKCVRLEPLIFGPIVFLSFKAMGASIGSFDMCQFSKLSFLIRNYHHMWLKQTGNRILGLRKIIWVT